MSIHLWAGYKSSAGGPAPVNIEFDGDIAGFTISSSDVAKRVIHAYGIVQDTTTIQWNNIAIIDNTTAASSAGFSQSNGVDLTSAITVEVTNAGLTTDQYTGLNMAFSSGKLV